MYNGDRHACPKKSVKMIQIKRSYCLCIEACHHLFVVVIIIINCNSSSCLFPMIFLVLISPLEMVESMKKVAKLDLELTVEERNLLSVGYKNVIGARRASWRILSSIEQKEEAKGNEINVKRIKEYRRKVEEELSKICSDILMIIDEHLIPSCTTGESTVFYYKMLVSLSLNLSLNFRFLSILASPYIFSW